MINRMRSFLGAALLLVILGSLLCVPVYSAEVLNSDSVRSAVSRMLGIEHREGAICVVLEKALPISAQEYAKDVKRSLPRDASVDCVDSEFIVIEAEEQDLAEMLYELNTDSKVKTAFPDFILELDESVEEYTDYDTQTTTWAYEKIKVMDSWNKGFTGKQSTLIAVLDTGYNSHVDISNANTSLARDVTTTPYSTNVADNHGHGTFIVGEICADLNSSGINGICNSITTVPIKIAYDNEGHSSYSCMRKGLVYAESIGAKVANLSYSLPSIGTLASTTSFFSGVVVFSAGNDNELVETSSHDQGKANDEPNWIVVGATESNDTKSSSSNYSEDYVDLFAPGSSIKSTSNDGYSYVTKSGTSFAAPMVSAAAGIIASHATHLSSTGIISYILNNVDQVSALNGLCVTGGRLNLLNVAIDLYTEFRGQYTLGDLTGDGYADSVDAELLRQYVLGNVTLTAVQLAASDINGNGIINSQDYNLLKRFSQQTLYFPPY